MDIVYENSVENKCKNIFVSDQSVMKERFTSLWTQVICEKESGVTGKNDVQTNLFRI